MHTCQAIAFCLSLNMGRCLALDKAFKTSPGTELKGIYVFKASTVQLINSVNTQHTF